MAHQTSLNKNEAPSLDGLLEGVGGLGANAATLAVLQVRLAIADLREAGNRMTPGLVAAVLLAPLAVASATAALLGLAYWLIEAQGLAAHRAFGVAALGGLILCIVLAVVAWLWFRAGMTAFRRSHDELERNIAWLGTILTRSGR